jgi:hypothetical protein
MIPNGFGRAFMPFCDYPSLYMNSRFSLLGLVAVATLFLAGCNYDVALTEKPTRNIDGRLIGRWYGGEDGKDTMTVRQLSDTTYVVAFDNDIYRAFHSDFAGMAFVSVESLQSGNEHGKYVFMTWALSTDASQLTLRTVSTKFISEETKSRADLQSLIKAGVANPALFNEPLVFSRKKP